MNIACTWKSGSSYPQTWPEQEFYDLTSNHWEIHNLSGKPEYRQKLREMRGILANLIIESDDKERFPEPETM